jgi:hypothetical protein
MSIIVPFTLLNGQYGPLHRPDDVEPPPSPGTPVSNVWYEFPIFPVSNAIETTYNIIIETLLGSPTDATFEAKFQTVSNMTQGGVSAAYFTDARPAFFDVTDMTLLPDGNWPAKLFDKSVDTTFASLATQVAATNTEIKSTGGKPFTKRIRGGFDHRLAIRSVTTAGSSPRFRLSIYGIVRYS